MPDTSTDIPPIFVCKTCNIRLDDQLNTIVFRNTYRNMVPFQTCGPRVSNDGYTVLAGHIHSNYYILSGLRKYDNSGNCHYSSRIRSQNMKQG